MNNSSVNNKGKSNTSKYTEDWLPVRDISNGMIVLENRLNVTGVKIKPRNIFILEQSMQDAIINSLKNFYNTIDFEFWLISADRPVDISGYLAKLQVLYSQVSSPVIRKLVSQDMQKANSFIENNVTDTEYYILFKEGNMDMINKKIRTLITGLANCGLEATQTSNQDLRVVLENFLNGGATSNFRTVVPYE